MITLKLKNNFYNHLFLSLSCFNLLYFIYGFLNQHDFSNGGKIDFEHIYNNFYYLKIIPYLRSIGLTMNHQVFHFIT